MSPDPEQTPKRNDQNSQEQNVASSDRTYWVVVRIACVLFCVQLLLYMYLVYGPGFWRKFFE